MEVGRGRGERCRIPVVSCESTLDIFKKRVGVLQKVLGSNPNLCFLLVGILEEEALPAH